MSIDDDFLPPGARFNWERMTGPQSNTHGKSNLYRNYMLFCANVYRGENNNIKTFQYKKPIGQADY